MCAERQHIHELGSLSFSDLRRRNAHNLKQDNLFINVQGDGFGFGGIEFPLRPTMERKERDGSDSLMLAASSFWFCWASLFVY